MKITLCFIYLLFLLLFGLLLVNISCVLLANSPHSRTARSSLCEFIPYHSYIFDIRDAKICRFMVKRTFCYNLFGSVEGKLLCFSQSQKLATVSASLLGRLPRKELQNVMQNYPTHLHFTPPPSHHHLSRYSSLALGLSCKASTT